jgi:hypothetical protein
MGRVFTSLQRLLDGCLHAISSRLTHWTKPLGTSLPLATLADLGKSKSQLIAENALLRQQLIVLRRQVLLFSVGDNSNDLAKSLTSLSMLGTLGFSSSTS